MNTRLALSRDFACVRCARLTLSMLAFPLAVWFAPSRTVQAQDAAQARLLQPADINALPLRDNGMRIAYGSDSLQFGELRLPAGPGPHPLVIVLHGGCWYSPYASARNSAPLAEALTDAGVATWNVEYRRYDHSGGDGPGPSPMLHGLPIMSDSSRSYTRWIPRVSSPSVTRRAHSWRPGCPRDHVTTRTVRSTKSRRWHCMAWYHWAG